MTAASLTGGCLCGLVRYRSSATAQDATLCHCRSCRLGSGAHVVAWVTLPLDSFAWTTTPPARYASSPGVERGFCPRCGCTLSYTHVDQPRFIDITVATLERADDAAPHDHTWMDDALAWDRPGDGLPRFRSTRAAGLKAG